MTVVSKPRHLVREDVVKWLRNLRKFLIPFLVIYVASIVAQMNDGLFMTEYLEPSAPVIGAMMLYLLNGILDLLSKFAKESSY